MKKDILSADAPILLLDSGVGGLSVLNECQKILPTENFVYFADSLNAPYGNKDDAKLKSMILCTVRDLVERFRPKSLVIACNTATSVAIHKIRKLYPELIVIGTEPAIRPAVMQGHKNLLLLATPVTLHNCKIVRKMLTNKNVNLHLCALPNLAASIDSHITDLEILKNPLKENLSKYGADADAVILGCTHYVFLKPVLRDILGDIPMFDGNVGIAKRLQDCLNSENKLNFTGKASIRLGTNAEQFVPTLKIAWDVLKESDNE